MLADTEFQHLAASLFHKHGEGALTYALRNARMLQSQDAELEKVWVRVARQIEQIISTTSQDRRISNECLSANPKMTGTHT